MRSPGRVSRSSRSAIAAILTLIVMAGIFAPPAVTGAHASVLAIPFSAAPTPTIAGTLSVGSLLTAKVGAWAPSDVTLSYQWKANGTPIADATKKTVTLKLAQAGKTITVSVTGRKTGYTTVTKTSAPTATVPYKTFAVAPTPTIAGAISVGSLLTAKVGLWTPSTATFTYQWKADGSAIIGATSKTLALTLDHVGKVITVAVRGATTGYTALTKTSAGTAAVPMPAVFGTAATQTQRMSDATLNSTQNGWYEAGAVLTLVCHRLGQSVQGYFSAYVGNGGWDSIWYKVSDGYYVADIDLETGTLEPVVPLCAGSSPDAGSNATVMVATQRMSDATLNSTQSGTYAQGARLTLVCYKHGQAVTGYFSPFLPNGGLDDLWYKVNDNYFVADVDVDTGSNDPVTPPCVSTTPPPSDSSILTRAKSWIDAGVPYNQGAWYTNQYGSYRQDCSGFVSMALGLPSSYVTGTLPQVLTPISKDQLQPGDIMLNTSPGNSGHTAIFVRWTDASHTQYVSWEENGMAGRAFEQTVPYPYWPSWEGSANYKPYRRS